jgi:Dolichyl-phosphate-mannose-protein mannosyltransferase
LHLNLRFYIRRTNFRSIFIVIPLLISGFTHLWNPIGFPYPELDEGTYLGRAILILEGSDPQDPYSEYDHPFFGQIFLASVFKIIEYPNIFTSPHSNINSLEMLFLVPRVLMGILAIADTFLIYSIAQRRYNRIVGFIASMLFAVMPITWLTRWIHLDSIQLPFLLASILFAIYYTENSKGNSNYGNKLTTFALLSGIFLGLSIFTKIPAFTMIPLIAYLVLTNSGRNFKILKIWFIPVILISLAWPTYAVSVGELDKWLYGVLQQAQRQSEWTLLVSINEFFKIDAVLLVLGIAGVTFAVIKRDLFVLLWVTPFTIFLYFVGFVSIFHLLPIIPVFCIAAARLIVYTLSKIHMKMLKQILPFVVILAVSIFGLVTNTTLIMSNDNSPYFKAAAFVTQYIQDSDNNAVDNNTNTTMIISSPFYLWIPKYKLHFDNYEPWVYIDRFNTENVLTVIDDEFRNAISANHSTAKLLQKIQQVYDTKRLAMFQGATVPKPHFNNNSGNEASVLLTDIQHEDLPQQQVLNLVNQNYPWEPSKYTKVSHNNSSLVLIVKTSKSAEETNSNQVVLRTHINLTGKPLLLSLKYASKSSVDNTKFWVQIKDTKNNNSWSRSLDNTSGDQINNLFVLPDYLVGKSVELRLNVDSKGVGEHKLIIKKAAIIYI